MKIRHIQPSDYNPIIHVLNDWWGGRRMHEMLPKLFFVHFSQTSFIAEENCQIIGFLIGFLSQTYPEEAYIHFAGVHPDFRKQGVGTQLYEEFFRTIQDFGRIRIKSVTSPINTSSIAYHLSLGFKIEPSETKENDVPSFLNYDGLGEHRVLFVKYLSANPGKRDRSVWLEKYQ
ncbi:GNAT family N-acetyltransferase [Xenococcus sp. PCC 7305]|uniref:GNAT family N-acetyltransferase n=1 Tax=Xenococcus sp. PCC 7305 TaxID=102125 RepID=UPI000593EA5E